MLSWFSTGDGGRAVGGRVGLRAANSESGVMSAAMQSPTPALFSIFGRYFAEG